MTAKTTAETRPVTSYVVLCDTGGAWAMAGTYEAPSAAEAKKKAVAANGGQPADAEWVAVPARSWKPTKRTVTTVEKETWS